MGTLSIWHIAIIVIVSLPAFLPLIIKKPAGRNIYGALPKAMGFGEAVQSCFRQYVSAHGRASRSEFWSFWLFSLLFNLGLTIVIAITKLEILNLLSLGLFLPSLCVGIRRLHDINRSGWWMLIQFGLGAITIFIMFLQPSDKDTRHLEEVF
jgi:hypothetical protein